MPQFLCVHASEHVTYTWEKADLEDFVNSVPLKTVIREKRVNLHLIKFH